MKEDGKGCTMAIATVTAAIIGLIGTIIIVLGPCNTPLIRSMASCGPPPPPGTVRASARNAVAISVYSSDTKKEWLDAVAASFNSEQRTTSGGHPIEVQVTHVKSGSSMQDILDGKIQPFVWSPGEQNWVDELNQAWTRQHGVPLITEECPATVYAPVGFAMWRPMAEAMGWPDEPIGWNDIVALAADPEGWARYGHPEWRQFKFGHTHPDYSNSGVLILTALAYATVGRTEGLTPGDVRSDAVEDAMRTVELLTYHYGKNSSDNTSRMVQLGPDYLHATNATEAEALRTNTGEYGEARFPLAFIFPADGTYWAEHPYCILDAEWSSDEQQEAARLFRDYLLQREQQEKAVDSYLRPLDPTIPLHAPIDLAHGTDPSVNPGIVPALEVPGSDVTGAIKDLFLETKKKATVVLLIDTSGSMRGSNKIGNATDATAAFINRLEPGDRVFAYVFDDNVVPLSPSGDASEVKETLGRTVLGLIAGGNTALHDAVCTAVAQVTEQQAMDEAAGDPRLYGIVLLSDGMDTSSRRTENEMFACLPSGEDVDSVKVFAIAYGDDASDTLLTGLANSTQGKKYDADPDSIESVYNDISAQ